MALDPPIFAATANKYYEAGIPVIPLHRREKKPIPSAWNAYHNMLPPLDLQRFWIENHPYGNIGVALGAQSGMMAIDIDTDDERLKKLIHEMVGPSPWRRVGAKGCVMMFKFNPNIKTFRIKTIEGKMLVECLSSRTQVVLPPSIHPTTLRPYEANCELIDVRNDLPPLPNDIETILRKALEEAGCNLSQSGWTRITDFQSRGSRDVSMTSVAGIFSAGVGRGERTLKEAMEMMTAWWSLQTEKVAGDTPELEKGHKKIVEFLIKDVLGPKRRILPNGWDDGLSDDDKKALGLNFTTDHEEWEVDKIFDYLKTQFEQHPEPHSPGRISAVHAVLDRLARSIKLTKLDEDRILKYVLDTGRLGVAMSTLRNQLRQLRNGGIAGDHQTEIAMVVIEDLQRVSPVRYHNEILWRWGGSDWSEMDQSDVERLIATDYGHLPMARKHNDHRQIAKIVYTQIKRNLIEKDVRGVNFANGYLTEELELLPHDPAYGMTYTLPFRYLPELAGRCFKFQDFLYKSWGHNPDYEQKVKALREALAITLFGMGPRLERVVLLHGQAKTGKSQLLKVAAALVPEEAKTAVNPTDWNDKFLVSSLAHALINVCGELPGKRLIDGRAFKQVVSGEEMPGQYKNKPIFMFRPKCTHWFGSNHLPRTEDTSSAFNRRWLVLHFDRVVPDSEKILDYGNLLVAEEREAITAWAIEALPGLLERGEYTLPESHADIIRDVASLNNSVRSWLTRSTRVKLLSQKEAATSPTTTTSERDLYEEFYTFCVQEGGVRGVTSNTFKKDMKDLGAELGFKPIMIPTKAGGEEPGFQNVILVDNRVRSASR